MIPATPPSAKKRKQAQKRDRHASGRKNKSPDNNKIVGDDASRRKRPQNLDTIDWNAAKFADFTDDDIKTVKQYLKSFDHKKQNTILKTVQGKKHAEQVNKPDFKYTYKQAFFDYMNQHHAGTDHTPVSNNTRSQVKPDDLVGQQLGFESDEEEPIPQTTEQLLPSQPVNLYPQQRMGQTVYTPVVLNTQGDEKFRIPTSNRKPPPSSDPTLTGHYYQFLNKKRPANSMGLALKAKSAYKRRVAEVSTMY